MNSCLHGSEGAGTQQCAPATRLIIGKDGRSAIGTLVERATRYVMLLHLPGDHGAESVRDALVTTVQTLPSHLTRSLTWDQGSEMGAHGAFTVATGIQVYFCDPASPWQRGSNENTYWCSRGGPSSFDGRGSAGSLGDSENTCRKAFR